MLKNKILKKITIAIDGFSSTGKSTLAKQLAKHLGYVYVDTGAMYRAVAFYAMQKGYVSKNYFDKESLIKDLPQVDLQFHFNDVLGFAEMFLNGKNVESEIRTLAVSNCVSLIAEISEVRLKLVASQQEMGKNKAIVMDGRDIGTVVFPDAELKIFMNSSAHTRAERRYKELIEKGQKVTFAEVLNNVEQRDFIDSTREDSPLLKAADAIEIDNSTMSKQEQFDLVLKLVNQKIK